MKKLAFILGAFFLVGTSQAQLYESYKRQGEFGVGLGVARYYGDLSSSSLDRLKLSAGIFFIKQFNNYIGLKISANYAKLGYSDVYSDNAFQKRRNLSFNSSVWEFAASGQFNFFKFMPGIEGFNYTPYVSLGLGVFSYDPYAYLYGEKYYLRPLGTEGQGSSVYPDRKEYGSMAVCIPISGGFKYSYNENINFFIEAGYRYTTTDYLDDVSTTYAGPDAFPPLPNGQPSPAFLLQDRSYETGVPIGMKDRQRGNSKKKDSYMIIQVGVSFNLTSYRCPPK
jgi:hypothetical protein